MNIPATTRRNHPTVIFKITVVASSTEHQLPRKRGHFQGEWSSLCGAIRNNVKPALPSHEQSVDPASCRLSDAIEIRHSHESEPTRPSVFLLYLLLNNSRVQNAPAPAVRRQGTKCFGCLNLLMAGEHRQEKWSPGHYKHTLCKGQLLYNVFFGQSARRRPLSAFLHAKRDFPTIPCLLPCAFTGERVHHPAGTREREERRFLTSYVSIGGRDPDKCPDIRG